MLVQLLCPAMILRYPDEDEYIRMAASAREAKHTLDELAGVRNSPIDAVEEMVIAVREDYVSHLSGWRNTNCSKLLVRHLAGLFLIGGTLLVASFVVIRIISNFRTVMNSFWG